MNGDDRRLDLSDYPITIRPEVKESLDRYAKEHCPTGSFLRAVLENDLMQAFGRADEGNSRAMYEICNYIYNKMPLPCHGSPKKVKEWLAARPTTQGEQSCEAH